MSARSPGDARSCSGFCAPHTALSGIPARQTCPRCSWKCFELLVHFFAMEAAAAMMSQLGVQRDALASAEEQYARLVPEVALLDDSLRDLSACTALHAHHGCALHWERVGGSWCV